MGVIQLGINGFGRIGRAILRASLQKPNLEITAINDPAIDIEYICYLIKFDSTHGKLNASITYTKDEILVNGVALLPDTRPRLPDKHIRVFREKLPSRVPWQTVAVQYVIEASGMFTTMEKASGHLVSEGVRRVIVTAPSVDVPMIILGVNDNKLCHDKKVISCASSTLYCLAPIIKVLEDNFGVTDGFVTSIHAMTPSLKPIDGLCLRGKHWRDHRSIHQNIIPATTGACKALGKVIPRVKDKLSGLAFRVPIVNVSVLDLTIRLNSNTSIQEIMEKVINASKGVLKNILDVSKENAVSSDFIGDSHSCILDMDSSLQLKSNFYKLICWYENEYSYACRVIDTIYVSQKQFLTEKIAQSIALKGSEINDSIQEKELSRKLALSSISQDTGLTYKIPLSVKLSKKPPLTNLCFVKQKMGKIYNGREKFVKSDISKGNDKVCQQSKEHIEYIRACERLNALKEELSKMVIITEKLLTKSFSGGKSLTKTDKQLKENTCNEGSAKMNNSKDCEVTSKDAKHLNYVNELLASDNSSETNNDERYKIFNKSAPQFHAYLDEGGTNNEIQSFGNNTKEILRLKPICHLAKSDEKNCINLLNNQKEINSANNLHNIQVQYSFIHENLIKNSVKNEINDITLANCKKYTSSLKHMLKPANSNNVLSNNCESADKNETNNQFKEMAESLVVPNIKMKSQIQLNSDYDAPKLGVRRISEHLSILSEDTSNGSPSTSITISNVEVYRHKEDIYDKLDSISGTDSNISFQTSERRSQIIDISELTSSLEDLARLDKICKIIEISDDLSNKLFSVLDSQTMDIKSKKWSFKDLCEKIKLDEFCDNLFRKP